MSRYVPPDVCHLRQECIGYSSGRDPTHRWCSNRRNRVTARRQQRTRERIELLGALVAFGVHHRSQEPGCRRSRHHATHPTRVTTHHAPLRPLHPIIQRASVWGARRSEGLIRGSGSPRTPRGRWGRSATNRWRAVGRCSIVCREGDDRNTPEPDIGKQRFVDVGEEHQISGVGRAVCRTNNRLLHTHSAGPLRSLTPFSKQCQEAQICGIASALFLRH